MRVLDAQPEGGEADELNLCRNTCTDGYCCFSDGVDSCRANNPDVCAKYDICVFAGIVFMSTSSIPNPPSNISDICSPQSVQVRVLVYIPFKTECASIA